MAEVRHRVGIRGSVADIYVALVEPNDLAGWWATSSSGTPEVGKTLDLTFGELVTRSFVVRNLETNSLVLLECSSGPHPWLGSRLRFSLEDSDDQVFVTLIHSNSGADDDSFLYFNTKWPLYLLSLRDFIEAGSGRPYPIDIKIHYGD
jgi:hypothetical protein